MGGMERAEWEVVLPARDTNRSPRLFSLLLSPSGSCELSIMHECQIQEGRSVNTQLGFSLIHKKETCCLDLAFLSQESAGCKVLV